MTTEYFFQHNKLPTMLVGIVGERKARTFPRRAIDQYEGIQGMCWEAGWEGIGWDGIGWDGMGFFYFLVLRRKDGGGGGAQSDMRAAILLWVIYHMSCPGSCPTMRTLVTQCLEVLNIPHHLSQYSIVERFLRMIQYSNEEVANTKQQSREKFSCLDETFLTSPLSALTLVLLVVEYSVFKILKISPRGRGIISHVLLYYRRAVQVDHTHNSTPV